MAPSGSFIFQCDPSRDGKLERPSPSATSTAAARAPRRPAPDDPTARAEAALPSSSKRGWSISVGLNVGVSEDTTSHSADLGTSFAHSQSTRWAGSSPCDAWTAVWLKGRTMLLIADFVPVPFHAMIGPEPAPKRRRGLTAVLIDVTLFGRLHGSPVVPGHRG
jgi:hypothetical protein